MEQQAMMSSATAMKPVTYAGFWKRFFAYLIDAIIMGIVCLIIFLPFIFIMGVSVITEPNLDDEDTQAGLVVALFGSYAMAIFLAFIAQWLYFALMESQKGATLGKMALGIKVTDMNGNMISFGRATGRYFGKILSGLIIYIGYIMAGFTQQKQALHDIIAGTLVVNK